MNTLHTIHLNVAPPEVLNVRGHTATSSHPNLSTEKREKTTMANCAVYPPVHNLLATRWYAPIVKQSTRPIFRDRVLFSFFSNFFFLCIRFVCVGEITTTRLSVTAFSHSRKFLAHFRLFWLDYCRTMDSMFWLDSSLSGVVRAWLTI